MECKQATMLISQSMDRKLSIIQQARLRFHLIRCSGCRNFKKQAAFLRKSCQQLTQPESD